MKKLSNAEINNLPAIFQSIYHGNIDAVDAYIAQGNDVNMKAQVGLFPRKLISFAAMFGQLDIVQRLLNAGCDPQESFLDNSLYCAATNGHLDIVNYLIDIGCDPQFDNNVAIRAAASNGHLEVVNRLIEVGSDLQDNSNEAIRFASFYEHVPVILALYDAALAQGKPIPGNITSNIEKTLHRRDMVDSLPVIFSKLAYEHGEALVDPFIKVAEYEGTLHSCDLETLENRTRAATSILASKL